MKITLYDYKDTEKVIDCPQVEIDNIDYIKVVVISGDETISIKLKNKIPAAIDSEYLIEGFDFDASDNRSINYMDGGYILKSKEAIERWLNFFPKDDAFDSISYERRYEFAPTESYRYWFFEIYDEDKDYNFPEII